jgi:MinD superfamily P-loop ATPase
MKTPTKKTAECGRCEESCPAAVLVVQEFPPYEGLPLCSSCRAALAATVPEDE